MGILKDLILLIATLFCINYFLKGVSQGILGYLVIISISALFGFSRGIMGEGIVLPLCLILCDKNLIRSNGWLVLYILLVAVFTIIKGNTIFGEYDEVMLTGFTLLSFRKYLFPNVYKVLSALWLYAQCKTINLVMLTGSSAFTIADANDMSTRMLETTTVYGETGFIDPNYFALVAGLGFIITLMMLKFKNKFNSAFSAKWFNNRTLLHIILLFDFFFTVRGLSRGVLLAIIGSYLVFLYYSRVKLTYIVLLLIVSGLIIVFAEDIPIVAGFMDRFGADDTGGGRYLIWSAVFDVMKRDGVLALFLGEGLNYHWWFADSQVTMGELLSTHNSFVNLFIATGFVGISIIVYVCVKAYRQYNEELNTQSICKALLLTYIILGCLSIEPLHFSWAWIVLALGCSGAYVANGSHKISK